MQYKRETVGGSELWNNIPVNIRMKNTSNYFKYALKFFLNIHFFIKTSLTFLTILDLPLLHLLRVFILRFPFPC